MLLRSLLSLPVVCLAIGTLWAANDPFVGKWKVNPSKSKLTDEMKVEVAGENKYTFTFGPGAVDTIVADGTDQPAMQGTTLSVAGGAKQLEGRPQEGGPHDRHSDLDAVGGRQNAR
jgi:hypothetical protein